MDVKQLEKQISLAKDAYYNDDPIMSDAEYDTLTDELFKLDPTNKVLAEIGATPASSEWVKMKHPAPLGSLEKFNTPEEVSEWVASKLNNGNVIVSEKLDGLSVGLVYEQGKLVAALSRGDGLIGDNILSNVIKMNGAVRELPMAKTFSGTVRGEIVLTKTNHKKFFDGFANPRNAASGICRRFDGEGSEHLTIMAYDVMPSDDTFLGREGGKFDFLMMNAFLTPGYQECRGANEIADLWQEYQDHKRDALDYDIDGLVIAAQDIKLQQTLGEHNLKPKWKKAFKFPNQFIKTIVNEIVWSTGGSSRITPVCWFNPVSVLGSTIEKASVYNAAYIKKLGIGTGAEVMVCKCNDIIPRVEKVITPAEEIASPPDFCPSCDTKVVIQGEYLICPNRDCKPQIVGRIARWVSELNILELGDTLIEKLVSDGLVKTPADLYTLSVDVLAKIDRMGKKSALNVYQSIWKCNPISLDLFLGSLSIPMIGSAMIRMLIDNGYDTLEKILTMKQSDIEAIKGYGAGAKAPALYQGLKDNKELIDQLLANGVQIKKESKMEATSSKLANQSFVFTGKMENKREALQQMVIENGGTCPSSVSKGTTYLVMASPDSSSSKAQKAAKYGTKLISEVDFLSMVAGE